MKKDWMIKESQLDDDQLKVLQATIDKSCIVSGCAGSGKSVLALIKAQRIQKERGNDYIVIVYTKALCGYMNAGKEELKLSGRFYYYEQWKRLGKPGADYIIVDEIQDFTKEEIREFIDATNEYFFFFGDTAQSIYDAYKQGGTVPVSKIFSMVPDKFSPKQWELYRNYRLPIPVAKAVQTVGVDLDPFIESTYQSTETEVPRFLRCTTRDNQIEEIHNIIKQRMLTDVAILLPDNNYVKDVYDKLKNKGGDYELKYNNKEDWKKNQDSLDFNTPNPKVMTYHSAKGLQFETVFLPLVESFSGDRRALYVAMTRTYRNLYVLYSGILPSPLSKIDSKLYKTTKVDEVKDI